MGQNKNYKAKALKRIAPHMLDSMIDILNNRWGDFMFKGMENKRYTPEFKKIMVETM